LKFIIRYFVPRLRTSGVVPPFPESLRDVYRNNGYIIIIIIISSLSSPSLSKV